jgi:glycerol-3-phosphate O-acyltransferase
MPTFSEPRLDEPAFPEAGGRRVVFLLDAASRLEEKLLRGWIARHAPAGAAVEAVPIPSSRRRPRQARVDGRLEAALATGDDALFAPLRVIWRPPARGGVYQARLSDLVKLGDPRDPSRLREHFVLRKAPERVRIVAGAPATASALRERWRESAGADAGATVGLAEFVVRQALLVLDIAERQLRGARYKVPRFVHEDVLWRPAFRGELRRLAAALGRDYAGLVREASADLREIAATHSPFVIDLVVQLWQLLYRRGYGEVLHYDPAQIDALRTLSQRHPVVFLPSHKSNLDHGVLQAVLHENGLPPNHTAGGINMNFFPLGPLVRRAGVFFIRRSFKDDEVYKLVLRHYIDTLIEKRFPLEWYIEGGRSRSGKLLPPRFGMLAYVVDAFRRGRSEDVALLPVSICYDQISDVSDYAAEQQGAAKERESFFWFLRILRRLGRRYGRIVVRFGEPVSLRKALGPPDPSAAPDPDERSLALQKLGFEVCVGINRATPITPISLVCLALLGRGDRALSVAEMIDALHNLVAYVERLGLPTSEPLALDTPEGVRRTLDLLVESRLLERFDEGPDTVWGIAAGQHLAAAYYRNTVIHYFVNGAIAELALLRAAEPDVRDRRREFGDEALRLRDLLKFEFFFTDKDVFRGELAAELALHDPHWEKAFEEGPEALAELVARVKPLSAHRVLRPFLEAYRVVADVLVRRDPDAKVEEEPFLRECLALGRQYALQRRIEKLESVSKVTFASALALARNRGLCNPETPDLAARRRAFAHELREVIRRVEGVQALVRARQAGVQI